MSKLTAILISAENAAELRLALDTNRGRAKVFPMAFEIIAAAERAEKRLSAAGVAASSRAGCVYTHCEAGPTAKAYKYKKTVMQVSF